MPSGLPKHVMRVSSFALALLLVPPVPLGLMPEAVPPVEIDWRTLAQLNYRTGEMPEALKKLDGQIVRMPGFVVPLEDYVESASEFLLVPYYGACVHVPPPPPNQMVYVEMQERKKAEFGWWEPIWLEGKLHINNVESPYGMVGFQIDGVKVEPYKN